MKQERWERFVPVYGFKVLTTSFWVMLAIFIISKLLVGYREVVGLGPTTGMSDIWGWGIWKTFNVMVVTALGSGGIAVGLAAWVFNKKSQHQLSRVALLTSFLAYLCGLILLGVDVGRPWNFYWIFFPWNWNLHSPLAEVAVCMTVYATIPLALENVTPILEKIYYHVPSARSWVDKAFHIEHMTFPFVVALAYLLPMMHQSSLGALMLLGGGRVHELWQTPILPLLYVWAALYMGYACVAGVTLLGSVVYKRPIDFEVMSDAAKYTTYLIVGWAGLRLLDILVRFKILSAFYPNRFALVFWIEMAMIGVGTWWIWKARESRNLQSMFNGFLLICLGGAIYRFSPTTLAFVPKAGAIYFPAPIEIIISFGSVVFAVMLFMVAIKVLAIMPAPNRLWYEMAEYTKKVQPGVKLVEPELQGGRTGHAVAGD